MQSQQDKQRLQRKMRNKKVVHYKNVTAFQAVIKTSNKRKELINPRGGSITAKTGEYLKAVQYPEISKLWYKL